MIKRRYRPTNAQQVPGHDVGMKVQMHRVPKAQSCPSVIVPEPVPAPPAPAACVPSFVGPYITVVSAANNFIISDPKGITATTTTTLPIHAVEWQRDAGAIAIVSLVGQLCDAPVIWSHQYTSGSVNSSHTYTDTPRNILTGPFFNQLIAGHPSENQFVVLYTPYIDDYPGSPNAQLLITANVDGIDLPAAVLNFEDQNTA